jgi:hypothetical protein
MGARWPDADFEDVKNRKCHMRISLPRAR